MRRLLMVLVLAAVCLLTGGCGLGWLWSGDGISTSAISIPSAYAELNIGEVIKKVPDWKQGVSYSLADSEFNYISTLELVRWKGFSFEGGYNSENAIVGVASYQLLSLEKLGVTVPALKWIECNIGAYVAYKRLEIKSLDDAEFDYGISASLISLKF